MPLLEAPVSIFLQFAELFNLPGRYVSLMRSFKVSVDCCRAVIRGLTVAYTSSPEEAIDPIPQETFNTLWDVPLLASPPGKTTTNERGLLLWLLIPAKICLAVEVAAKLINNRRCRSS